MVAAGFSLRYILRKLKFAATKYWDRHITSFITTQPPSRGMTFLSVCFFVIPAEAGIQTFFSLDVLQLFYE